MKAAYWLLILLLVRYLLLLLPAIELRSLILLLLRNVLFW
jgi:hypothetical protein